MKKVIIKSKTISNKYRVREAVEVFVDNVSFGEECYGDIEAPEDNSRGRDYSWIEPLLKQLAETLGAEVEIEEVSIKE
jgi:hypothetical protein